MIPLSLAIDSILPRLTNPIPSFSFRYIQNLTLKRHFHIKQEIDKNIFPYNPTTSYLSIIPSAPPESNFELSEINIDNLDEDETLRLFTQHLATPPIVHSSLRPKSIFFPTHSKDPHLETFYRGVYADFVKLCNSTSASKHDSFTF